MTVTLKASEQQANATGRSHAYMPGLDVFRGVAILLVLLYHGFASQRATFEEFGNPILLVFWRVSAWGVVGVHLFFILSGFLISGILLDGRNKPDYYSGFYLRRVLRIAPAYIVMLLILRATHWITWPYFAVCMVYLANVCSLFHLLPMYGPLWSLSVEEQFYLTWPTLVKRLSNRALAHLSIAMVVLTPILRIFLSYLHRPYSDWPHKPWGLGDFFAAGALLALAVRSPRMTEMMRRLTYPMLALGGCLVLAAMYMPDFTNSTLQHLWSAIVLEPFLVFWTACIMFAFFNPGIATLLALRPLVFLADISYGLYLVHQFVFTNFDNRWAIAKTTPGAMLGTLFLRFALETAAAIAVAWVSRRTLEAFFLRLKPKRNKWMTAGAPVAAD